MSSLRYNVESVVAEVLGAQSSLSALSIVHFAEDDPPAKNRLVIKAEEPEVEIPDKDARTAVVWRVPVSLTLYLSARSKATLDSYDAAILAAMQGEAPAEAVTLAEELFPDGIEVHSTEENEVGGEGTKLRMLKRGMVVYAVFDATGASGDITDALLLEGGDFFLLESGDYFLLEAA